jgi:hypothetical protein
MIKLFSTVFAALVLVACGGGGGSWESGQSPTAGNLPLKAKIVAPDSTLLGAPASLVNTTTAGNQVLRTVGATDDGGYTVAWVSSSSTVQIQRYDSSGAKEGGETLIPLSTEDAARQAVEYSATSVLSDGRVVIAYLAIRNTPLPTGTLSTRQSLNFQVFDSNGGQLVGETEVAFREEVLHSRSSYITDKKTAALADGGFVLGWTVASFSSSFGFTAALFLQRYDSQAQPVGGVIQVGQFPGLSYSIVADAHGGFTLNVSQLVTLYLHRTILSVIHYDVDLTARTIVEPAPPAAWLLPLADGYVLFTGSAGGSIRQALDSAAQPVGEPSAFGAMPQAARELSDGSYVLIWADGGSFIGQRFAPDGTPMGAALPIQSSGVLPEMAALADDVGFALAWSVLTAPDDWDVFTQRFVEVSGDRKKACLNSAKGLRGHARKAFMNGCMA